MHGSVRGTDEWVAVCLSQVYRFTGVGGEKKTSGVTIDVEGGQEMSVVLLDHSQVYRLSGIMSDQTQVFTGMAGRRGLGGLLFDQSQFYRFTDVGDRQEMSSMLPD